MKKSYTPEGFWYRNATRFSSFLGKSGLILFLLVAFFWKSNAQTTPTYYERVYATSQENGSTGAGVGNVKNADNASDGNLATYSTLNLTVGLLGGGFYQSLIFPQPVPANTPVTVKIEVGGGLLALLSGVEVYTGYNGNLVGGPIGGTNLLTLLGGPGENEITLTSPSKIDRIVVKLAGVAVVGQSIKVYDAYYNKTTTTPVCNSTPIDVLTGAIVSTANLAQFTGTVDNPHNAIDGDINTYASLHASTTILGYTYETVVFSGYSMPGDTVRIALSKETGLLDLALLADRVQITTYKDFEKIDDLDGGNALLKLSLLAGTNTQILSFVPSAPINRVQIKLGGLVEALGELNIHEITVGPPAPEIVNGDISVSGDTMTVCSDSTFTLSVNNPQTGMTYNWYDRTGASIQGNASSIDVGPLSQGIHIYKVTGTRSACTTAGDTATVVINVTEPEKPVTTPATDTTICSGDTVVLSASSDVPETTFNWYTEETGGTPIRVGHDTIQVWPSATQTYYVASVLGSCISAERTAITVNVNTTPQAPTIDGPVDPLCVGDSVELSIDGADANVTYRWYADSNSTEELHTGSTFQTHGLTDTTTYYVEAVGDGDCVAAGIRSAFTVDVAPATPAPVLITDTIYTTTGQSVTFEVFDSTDIVYNWYTDSEATSPAHTGTSYTTQFATAGEHKVFVEAVNAGGCASPERAAAVAIVSEPDGSVTCNFANAQQSPVYTDGILSLCVFCGVKNPALAIDGDTTTASDIRITIGLSQYIGQRVQFQHQGQAGDSIRLILGFPGGLVDLDALGGHIRLETYQGDQPNGDIQNVDGALIHLRLLGGNKFAVTVPVDNDYDGILVSYGGSLAAGALTTLNLYNAEQLFALPIIAPESDTVEVCKGTTTTLNVTAPANTTLKWYNVPSGGTAVHTGTSYEVGPINDSTVVYVTSVREGCENPDRAQILVVPAAAPDAPVLVEDALGSCAEDSVTFEIDNPQSGIKYYWYADATGNTPLDSGETFTTPALTGSTAYYVEAQSGDCATPSDRVKVSVTVDPTNQAADITVSGNDAALCVGDTANLTATSNVDGALFIWYADADLTDVIDSSASISVYPDVETTYYVTVYGTNSCENVAGDALEVTVSVSDLPQAPVITGPTPATICAGKTATLEIQSPQTGITYNWYTDTTSATPLATGTSYTTNSLTDTTTFYVRAVNGNGCVAAGGVDSFTVNVNAALPIPVLVPDTLYASAGDSVVFQVKDSTGITYTWYDAATGGNEMATGATFTTPVFGGEGTHVYYVEARNADGCTSPERAKAVAIIYGPTDADCYTPNAQQTMYSLLCLACTVEQPLNAIDGDTTTHSDVRMNVGLVGNVAQYLKFQHGGKAGDTLKLMLGQSGGDLLDLGLLNGIRIWFYDNGQDAGGPYSLDDQNLLTLKLLNVSVNKTTVSIVAPVDYDGIALGIGGTANVLSSLYIYQVEQHFALPTVDADSITACAGEAVTLSATANANGDDIVWYDATGAQAGTGSTFTVDTLTQSTTYYVTSRRGDCVSPDRVPVTVTILSGAKASDLQLTGPTGPICAGDTTAIDVTLSATATGITAPVFIWYSDADLTDSLFTGTSYDVHPTETVTYYVTVQDINNGVCENAPGDAAEITVSVNDKIDPQTDINVVGDSAICSGTTTDLVASAGISGGTFRWYADSTLNTLLASGDTYSVTPDTTTTYYVTLEADGYCQSEPKAVRVPVASATGASDIDVDGDGASVCEGDEITLTANSTTVDNAVFNWYSDTTAAPIHTGAELTATITSDTTFYVKVSGDNACATGPASGSKEVHVYVNPFGTPADIKVTGNSDAICKGDSTVLEATASDIAAPVFTWYADDALIDSIGAGSALSVQPDQTTTYYVTVQGTDACENIAGNAKEVVVTVTDLPEAPSISGPDPAVVCAGQTVTLNVTNAVNGVTYKWYTDTTGAPVHTGTSYTTDPLADSTTFYVDAVGDDGCVAGGAMASFTVNVNAAAPVPVLVSDTLYATVGDSVVFHVQDSAGITYKWYDAATGGQELAAGAAFTTPVFTSPGTNVYYVDAINGEGCSSPKRAKAVAIINEPTNVNCYLPNEQQTLYSLLCLACTVEDPMNAIDGDTTTYSDVRMNVGLLGNVAQYLKFQHPGKAGDTLRLMLGSSAKLLDLAALNGVRIWFTNGSDTAYGPVELTKDLLDVELLNSGTNKTTVSIVAPEDYDGIAIGIGGLAVALKSLYIYQVEQRIPLPTIVTGTDDLTICAGETATLEVTTTGATQAVWYDATGAQVHVGEQFTTPALDDTTTYYVTAMRYGCPSPDSLAVTVNVNPGASASDIQVSGGDQPVCSGDSIVLEASSTTVPDPVFHWYSDEDLTDTLHIGTSFKVAPETTTTYYVTVLGTGICENAPGSAKEVTVTVNPHADSTDADVTGGGENNAICVGESTELTASSTTVPNPVFNWYSDAALDTKVHTGAKFTVNPEVTTTYYVTVLGDGFCETEAGAADSVTVYVSKQTDSTDIDIDGGGENNAICVGESTELTASSTTVTNPVFNWYSDATLDTKVHTGASFTVNPEETTTYYVTVLGDGFCETEAGAADTVTVYVDQQTDSSDIDINGGGEGNGICVGESTELTASSTTVTNPVFNWYSDATLDTKVHTGASFTVNPEETTTYYVTVLGDGFCETEADAADTVTVYVDQQTDSTDIDINGGGESNAICAGETTELTASSTTVTNPVFTWYSDATLDTKVHTGAKFTVSPEETTSYYVTVMGEGFCETPAKAAKKVTVYVDQQTDSTDIDINGGGEGNAICAGETTELTASSTTITKPIFTWYSDATLDTKVHTGAKFTVSPEETTSYYVTVMGEGFCETPAKAAKKVTVYVDQQTDSTDIDIDGGGANNGICVGESTELTASSTTVTSPVFNWYSDASLKNKVHTGAKFTVSPEETTTYYVTVMGKGFCETPAKAAKKVTVYVNKESGPTDIDIDGGGANNGICVGESTELTASSTTVPNPVFSWYSDASLKTKVHTGASFTVSPEETTTYYVTVMGDDFCENPVDAAKEVTVYVNKESGPTDIDIDGGGENNGICVGESTELTASSTTVTNPVFNWYSDASLKNKVHTGASFTVSPEETTTYYVTVMGDDFCENPVDAAKEVTVYVNKESGPTDIDIDGGGAGNAICAGETTELTASSTTVTNPVFNWYSDASLKNKVHTGASFTVSPDETTTYYVTVMGDDFCENPVDAAKEVTVYVNKESGPTDIDIDGGGAGNAICAGETTELTASSTTVTNPVFNWYSDASLKNKVHTGAHFTVSPEETTTYYVTVIGDDHCENPVDAAKEVTVHVNPQSGPDDIHISGNSGGICAGESAKLEASSTTVTNPVFTWYSDATLKTKVHTGASFTVSPEKTMTYYVTVMGDDHCENPAGQAKEVKVVVNETPHDPEVKGPADEICSGIAPTLTIENPQSGVTYNWYSDADLKAKVHSGTSFTTGPLTATTTFYVVAVSNSGCSSASGSTSVTVKVAPKPEPPKVRVADIAVCLGSKATFEIEDPQAGMTYNWYTTATAGAPVFTGSSFITAALQGDLVYYVEVATAAGCASTQRTKVTASAIQAPVQPTVSGPSGPICPGETATLQATSTTSGATYHWYSAATGGTELASGDTYTTEELDQTTDFYVEVQVSGGCVNSGGRTKVTVEVTEKLPAPQVQVKETTASSVTFEWAPITGATGYKVSTDAGTTWADPSSGATGTTHTVTGLQPNDKVTLIVKALGASTCQDSDPSIAVTGEAKNPLGDKYFIPNAFSPNGDGTNDEWKVYGNTIKDIHMMVYNQYGQKIFESRNINDGWDGTYKGKMQPVGVYVYYVEITFTNDSKTDKSGSITLIR